jgi:hypothetical protein
MENESLSVLKNICIVKYAARIINLEGENDGRKKGRASDRNSAWRRLSL